MGKVPYPLAKTMRPGPKARVVLSQKPGEAHLIALTCSKAPKGYQRWTLQLLADRMVGLGYVDTISYETVRRVLKKTNLSLG